MQNLSSINSQTDNFSFLNNNQTNNYVENTHFNSPPSFEKNPQNISPDPNKYYEHGYATLARKMSNHKESEVSKLYFSSKNIERIQKKIRREVYNHTQGKFRLDVDQDESDLQIVMNKINEEFNRHLPNNIIHQVKNLNNETMKYIMPDIITNLKQHYGYLKDISIPLEPIQRPMQVRTTNVQSLPSVDNFNIYNRD